MFEIFEHTADVGLRMTAGTLDELFADAARGLVSLIMTNPNELQPRVTVEIRLRGDELDLLLFDWLNELLYRFDTEHFLPGEIDVQVQVPHLKATVRGESLDPTRHQTEHEVKAITYHGLKVERRGDKWLAEVIVDI